MSIRVLFACLWLAGCGPSWVVTRVPDSMTRADVSRIGLLCQGMAGSPYAGGYLGALQYNQTYRQCLEANGIETADK